MTRASKGFIRRSPVACSASRQISKVTARMSPEPLPATVRTVPPGRFRVQLRTRVFAASLRRRRSSPIRSVTVMRPCRRVRRRRTPSSRTTVGATSMAAATRSRRRAGMRRCAMPCPAWKGRSHWSRCSRLVTPALLESMRRRQPRTSLRSARWRIFVASPTS